MSIICQDTVSICDKSHRQISEPNDKEGMTNSRSMKVQRYILKPLSQIHLLPFYLFHLFVISFVLKAYFPADKIEIVCNCKCILHIMIHENLNVQYKIHLSCGRFPAHKMFSVRANDSPPQSVYIFFQHSTFGIGIGIFRYVEFNLLKRA